jgi:hypothetical protein
MTLKLTSMAVLAAVMANVRRILRISVRLSHWSCGGRYSVCEWLCGLLLRC